MLKWAVGKDDRPINSTKSLKKRRKAHQVDMQRDPHVVGLISGKRIIPQGPSKNLHKNRHRVGVINNHPTPNNDPDNGKPSVHNNNNNYNYKDAVQTQTIHTEYEDFKNTSNNKNIINSENTESRSLLYMRLDSLPMAIVKQYERMLQDTPFKSPLKSVLKSQCVPTAKINTNSITTTNNSNNHTNRPPSVKLKSQKQHTSHKKSHSKSIVQKSIAFVDHVTSRKTEKAKAQLESCNVSHAKKIYPTPVLKSLELNVKEAHHRPLKVLSPSITTSAAVTSSNTIVKFDSNIKTPSSSEVLNDQYQHNLVCTPRDSKISKIDSSDEEECPVLPVKKYKSRFPVCDTTTSFFSDTQNKTLNLTSLVGLGSPSSPIPKVNSTIALTSSNENKQNTTSRSKECSLVNDENNPNSTPNLNTKPPTIHKDKLQQEKEKVPQRKSHDTTDPEFLEKPITYSTPPVPRRAKKLTLKRGELKKLEKLRDQTEKLNRFLRKYLPNLPEEEEDQCSPEEKSVRLSILRTHWSEVKSLHHQNHKPNYYPLTSDNKSSDVLDPPYRNVDLNKHQRYKLSGANTNNKFQPLLSSSFDHDNSSEFSINDYWENLRNVSPALISYSNDATPSTTTPRHLPIIPEDSAEVSSNTSSSENHSTLSHFLQKREVEVARDTHIDDTFLMSRTQINPEDSLVILTKESMGLSDEYRNRVEISNNFNSSSTTEKISFDGEEDLDGNSDVVEEEGGFGIKKLKALMIAEPLGGSFPFDLPASSLDDEGFMSPCPNYSPASTSSTFNRFSVSSSGKGSTDHHFQLEDDVNHDYDKLEADQISNLDHIHTSSQSLSTEADAEVTSEEGGPKYIMELKHENANYDHNETWNSHGYFNSVCGLSTSPSFINQNYNETKRKNDHEEEEQEESFISNSSTLDSAISTPMFNSKRHNPPNLPQTPKKYCGSYRLRTKKSTPRKVLVRKPLVNTQFSKGEVLIHTYKNGNFITIHVLQARKLEKSLNPWKLALKVSLLNEPESSFTKSSELVLIRRDKSCVRIDQKFSFEIPRSSDIKVFFTLIKRVEKKSQFLGWTTLSISNEENTNCWLKLRKRKMSTATYSSMQTSVNHCHSSYIASSIASSSDHSNSGVNSRHRTTMVLDSPSPSPQPVHTEGSTSSSRCDCEIEPKSQLQNSSTMDSGVEDCCEPPPPPSIDLDEKLGQRVTVKMTKQDGCGYGFSVVWVTPPRIERLEKGKVADVSGLQIADLIIGVNGDDVTNAPNTTIYTKMKTTGNDLELEIWRKYPQAQGRSSSSLQTVPAETTLSSKSSSVATAIESTNLTVPKDARQIHETQQSQCAACLPQTNKLSSTTSSSNHIPSTNQLQHPPVSILKPPPPAPPTTTNSISTPHPSNQNQQQPSTGSSSWRIRFNIELLDNEDDCLKQFFICELKFFRKIVAALDRYLIPAQSTRLLTPQEINLIFSNVIKIITVTKRILNCVANGSSIPGWKFSRVLLSTHSDHLSEIVSAYSAYAKTLGYSAMILSEKMSIQEFARFVLEITVPKGHLDMTSLLFAPLEHLRNICEICEEVSHNNEEWVDFFANLKECYADIVCDTDFMEPISHVSMKKNPLLSVRDLEKRVVSTSCQPVKVCEKGRRWLFGSRLFKKESDGSWTPVWAFLFSDIIVLTSHTTRDRVFFVKEPAIRLEDVVTLHFNLPRKHENEFRLLFGPEPVHQSRLDKILPIHRNKKSNQIILRTPNIQLKSMWKLLLQRQIITLNTRLSKSASSNFSISEFCERFPITPQCEEEDHESQRGKRRNIEPSQGLLGKTGLSKSSGLSQPQNTIFDRQNYSDERNLSVIKEEKSYSQSMKCQKPYAPDGLSSMTKELLKSRVTRITPDRRNRVEVIPEEIKVIQKPMNEPSDTKQNQNFKQESKYSPLSVKAGEMTNSATVPVTQISTKLSSSSSNVRSGIDVENRENTAHVNNISNNVEQSIIVPNSCSSSTPIKTYPINNNNNEFRDYNYGSPISGKDKCPCEVALGKPVKPARGMMTNADAKNREQEKALTLSPSTSLKPIPNKRHSIMSDEKNPEGKDRNSKNNHNEHKEDLVEMVESPKIGRTPVPTPRQGTVQNPRNNTPSPSISNNRVEALKYESNGVPKSKPGSKIMTNATLKCRQQEMLSNNKGETIITMVDKCQPDPNATTGTDCILISQHIEHRAVTTRDASSSPMLSPPRCQSENGFVKPKSIHTDSPILTGYGSEKSRRRILYDYKIQRDYPELFGITPKDRRSFIKQLAEKPCDNDKSFIAPYYFSPLPTPKFAKRPEQITTKMTVEESSQGKVKDTGNGINGSEDKHYPRSTATAAVIEKKNKNEIPSSSANSKILDDCQNNKQFQLESSLVECDEADDKTDNDDVSLKEIARGILRNVLDEETDEDSDESECQDEVRAQVHRHRSPEESSNDSGISDELTEKSKTTKENERFQSNMAVNSSEVNTVKFSPKINNTIVTHCDKKQYLPKKAHACHSPPNKSNKIDHVYFEGEEETGMETMVVLKSDKSTGTDDDYFNLNNPSYSTFSRPEKSMRTLMAERREAFFASYQSSSYLNHSSSISAPSSLKSVPENEPPLIVKILDGGTLHSTIPEAKPINKSPPTERVQLTRFPEKEKTARVERVESSDDSTSSDLASASPAAENGTTDPSWSSSSSSLAGCGSSKEDPSTNNAIVSNMYNKNYENICPSSSSQPNCTNLPSTSSHSKIFMSDFTNGLPHTSYCNFSNGSLSLTNGPEIVVTQESPETPTVRNGYNSDGDEEDSVLCKWKKDSNSSSSDSAAKKGFLRVESNDSTAENYGDDDDYNFDDEDDLSQCSVATINRYGTFESLEKIECEDSVGPLADFSRPMTRSKARFTFEDEDSDDDNDLFEEDFESDFNFRFPSQIQDNTYSKSSVSRLGPLPPLLEEDFEDDVYDEQRASSSSSCAGTSGNGTSGNSLRSRHEISTAKLEL